ncbi:MULTISPECIES: 3-oxo-tetronate kinase [Providencia]|uniref:3-oxo-tetronate kinase n=1 Tax=Providencia stuartii TaxID=588 RepID=A0ABD5L982_PROST|nr:MULTISPECIES: 3-oxo-tetronate kinase [Providencia]ELR5043429.1 four-carbon acid sugar kinase family protein [Providencia rettgeri]ELR5122845.1 four-carbon acid sugar kinase family protein [Providencia stuartii]ELR5293151.1 four-carbon acid sugar kinase family protein [Providencia stuartii]ELZ5941201.1 four-carbon acid sugar kinase family protein [Providencia stuartii]MBG5920754.1 four-carbon acid sugar kinase family protein [Providencia stuartii]
MTVKLGVIADDFTGATDIAGFMVQNGWRVVQLLNEPDENTAVPQDVDAIVISLKSRSCPVDTAINASLNACRWLKQQAHCQQIFFKYCSTFDSTEKGNIGPVTDALMQQLDTQVALICPALPINGRTVVHGHLFVNGQLLNESGMQHHPVTPMTDANLLRVMEKQSEGKAGLIPLSDIQQGDALIKQRLATLAEQGASYIVVDSLTMNDLLPIAKAVKEMPLLTGGSGLGAALANVDTGCEWGAGGSRGEIPASQGRKTIILSGSCSVMTNKQVQSYQQIAPAKVVDVGECIANPEYAQQLANWVQEQKITGLAPLLYATQPPEILKKIQENYGAEVASSAVENVFGEVVKLLQAQGYNTFIIAGGETSGKVVQSLGTEQLSIGAPIAPGVPWVQDLTSGHWLALKSGNFGQENFFQYAQEMFNE